MPSLTAPLGVSVFPVPTFALLYISVKVAVSVPCSTPEVIVGVAAAAVVASYSFVFVAAVTVNDLALIMPVVSGTNVTA